MSANPISAGPDRLRARRRRARTHLGVLVSILVIVVCGSLIWLAWQPYMRITQVTMYGETENQSFAGLVQAALQGSYAGIIPRNFTFVYPAGAIRKAIITAEPQVAAVATFRAGFTGLTVEVSERVPVARWCGSSDTPEPGSCYLFDASGYLYATATEPFTASSTPAVLGDTTDGTLNPFAVFAPLTASTSDPLGATIADVSQLPPALAFAREASGFGSSVVAVDITSDGEADDYLASGTRLSYVLGQEQQAFSALSSSIGDLNLADGSIDYVDLRFPGKVYFKKTSADQTTSN